MSRLVALSLSLHLYNTIVLLDLGTVENASSEMRNCISSAGWLESYLSRLPCYRLIDLSSRK